jgi:NTP pyrophosphatase (non-canonical NTP hydrolase)
MTISDVGHFLQSHGLICSPEHRLLDLSSELGEVCKEVLKASNYGAAKPTVTSALIDEIGDLLFCVHALAIECGLDPDETLKSALRKYEARQREKGHIGSGTRDAGA